MLRFYSLMLSQIFALPVKCQKGELVYLDYKETSAKHGTSYEEDKFGSKAFYQLHTKENGGFSHDKISCFITAESIFNDQKKIMGSKMPLLSDDNNFLTVLNHLLMYLQGYNGFGNQLNKDVWSIASRRNASLVVISDMNCLSFDSQGKLSGKPLFRSIKLVLIIFQRQKAPQSFQVIRSTQ